jgi:hypothetical protein
VHFIEPNWKRLSSHVKERSGFEPRGRHSWRLGVMAAFKKLVFCQHVQCITSLAS